MSYFHILLWGYEIICIFLWGMKVLGIFTDLLPSQYLSSLMTYPKKHGYRMLPAENVDEQMEEDKVA